MMSIKNDKFEVEGSTDEERDHYLHVVFGVYSDKTLSNMLLLAGINPKEGRKAMIKQCVNKWTGGIGAFE